MVEGMVVGRGGTVGGTVLAVLAERGPLELGELARLVAERGATRAKRPEVSVRRAAGREPRVVSLLDGRWVSVPAVLEGVVLTHRLDQDEADGEMLPIDSDLASLAPLAIAGLRLVAGGDLELCSDAHLHGPSGWLGGLGAGELVALRVRGGAVEVGPARVPAEVEDLGVRRLLAVVERELSKLGTPGEGGLAAALPLALVVLQAMVEAPGLLRRATVPLGELLTGAGFETRSWLVGRGGADWREWDEIFADGEDLREEDLEDDGGEPTIADIAGILGLDERAVEGAAMIVGVIELCARQPGALAELRGAAGLAGRLAEVLDVEGVAELVQLFGLQQPAAEGLLRAVAEAASGRLRAAPTWLLARAVEQRGDAPPLGLGATPRARAAPAASTSSAACGVWRCRWETGRCGCWSVRPTGRRCRPSGVRWPGCWPTTMTSCWACSPRMRPCSTAGCWQATWRRVGGCCRPTRSSWRGAGWAPSGRSGRCGRQPPGAGCGCATW